MKSKHGKPLCTAATASAIQDKWGGGSFFEKLWSHCILVMAYTNHLVWSIAFYLSILAMLESEKFPFPSYFYFASFDRGEDSMTFFTSKEKASKRHKASHEDYSWLFKPIDDDIESLLKLMPPGDPANFSLFHFVVLQRGG